MSFARDIGHTEFIPSQPSVNDGPTHFDNPDSEAGEASFEGEAWVDISAGAPAAPLLDEEGNCLGPTYAGAHIEDTHDAQVIIDAFINGHLHDVCLHHLNRQQLSMLVASGNIIIYRGLKYQDGHSWTKRNQRKRDALKLQIYSSTTIKGLQKFLRKFDPTPDTSYRLVSYQKVDETFPRASSIPQLLQFANRMHRNPPIASVSREPLVDNNSHKETSFGKVPYNSYVGDQPQAPGYTQTCALGDTTDFIATPNPGNQQSWVNLYFPTVDSPVPDQAQLVSGASSDPFPVDFNVSEWTVINREGDHRALFPNCDSNPMSSHSALISAAVSTTPATSTPHTNSLSLTCSPEYFQVFVQFCPHLSDLPRQLTENRQYYLHRFFSRIVSLHMLPGSSCFAATETFALDHEGTPCVLAFLAVLRQEFDIYLPQQNVDSTLKCRKELLVDFVVLSISDKTSAPFTWLGIQSLGAHFVSERLKRAAWALGQLRPGSHAPDSATFKWVRQVWTREPLRSGTRQVVDLLPGDPTQEWPPLRRLKTRLYHPANFSLNSELMALLDEDLRLACRQSLQEWLIALVHELARRPNDALMMCYVYRDYMIRVAELQIEAFAQTGYTSALHTCSHMPCDHPIPFLQDVKLELYRTLGSLIDSLVDTSLQGHFQLCSYPSNTQLQYAIALGLNCYWVQVSYILLSPAERLHYDCLCRTSLNALRSELTEKVGSPVLIWNYLPDDIQAWAAKRRQAWEARVIDLS